MFVSRWIIVIVGMYRQFMSGIVLRSSLIAGESAVDNMSFPIDVFVSFFIFVSRLNRLIIVRFCWKCGVSNMFVTQCML